MTKLIETAVHEEIRILYFDSPDVHVEDYINLPQPFTTCDMDTDKFLELPLIHRQMIYKGSEIHRGFRKEHSLGTRVS